MVAAGAWAEQAQTVSPTTEEITLQTMLKQGGPLLWVVLALGAVGLVWGVYLILTARVRREAPSTLAKRVLNQLRAGEVRDALQMCQDRDEILAHVFRTGLRLKLAGHEAPSIRGAMEAESDRAAMLLWQRVAYLSHGANMAFLLGLLGTVWGMMQAFGAVAYDASPVRTVAIAAGVSTAMAVMAGGLCAAIPLMAMHYFLRGRVMVINAEIGAVIGEFTELLGKNGKAN
jgi:biopolymer transport protein ExbB